MTIPAAQDWALLLRLAVSGAGALFDLSVELLEDLRTAMDECCDLLLHQRYTAQSLLLEWTEASEGVLVSLSAQDRTSAACKSPAENEIAKLILGTLVHAVDFEQSSEEGIVRILLTVHTGNLSASGNSSQPVLTCKEAERRHA